MKFQILKDLGSWHETKALLTVRLSRMESRGDMMQGAPMVCVVDDDSSVLKSLERILRLEGYDVRTFLSGEEYLAVPPPEGPHCVITDLRMPGLSGLEFQQRVRQTAPATPFIFLTGHGGVTEAVRAMKAGAADFLEKPVDLSHLLPALKSAIERHRQSLEASAMNAELERRFGTLSPRERQVCAMVAEGLLNKEIAARLGTSEKTVKVQRGRAMKKLNAGTTAALVNMVVRVKGASA